MMKGFRCMLVSWRNIEDWVSTVIEKIESDGYKPEIIVGLARGGLVPARLISDRMQLKDLYAVKTEHWGITATPDGQARITQTLPINISGKRVLVVDDITDTGQSLSLAVEHVRGMGPSELRSATLLHILHSKYRPDYYADEVPEDKWTWFIFPWNVYEDLTNITLRILEEGEVTIESLQRIFVEYFQIRPKRSQLNETLSILMKKGKVAKAGKFYRKL
ncbi:MAG: phosphoribosyltransferase [Aciduliprofundum sp.]|nr:phosphoribosyltransferase [Thermoplasmatales archaeon]PMP74183.1 MAG: phosphoribosyltransferase [Aciduliprofundum sp.]